MQKLQPIITKELPRYPIDEEVEEDLELVGGAAFLAVAILLVIVPWIVCKLI